MDEMVFQQAQEWADYCRIFSNTHRVLIVWALAKGELSVGEIAEEIKATLQNTSQHLRSMKDCGFVKARREGQTIYYKITDHPFFDDCAILRKSQEVNQILSKGEI